MSADLLKALKSTLSSLESEKAARLPVADSAKRDAAIHAARAAIAAHESAARSAGDAGAVAAWRDPHDHEKVYGAATMERWKREAAEDGPEFTVDYARFSEPLYARPLPAKSEAPPAGPVLQAPIPMLLFCPKCHAQHVDAPEPGKGWTNPPHKSHLCHACGAIWRPADVATAGVLDIATCGESDNWQRPGWAAGGGQ